MILPLGFSAMSVFTAIIPVRAGGGLYPISDIRYIDPGVDTAMAGTASAC